MVGLQILPYIETLRHEQVVMQFKRNPYYQVFCGLTEFYLALPCDRANLVYFRKRIGTIEFEKTFHMNTAIKLLLSVHQ